MNRVIPIDKPSGITSHDVVARIRRSSRIKKVGHTGTLDPAATGLLVILTGKATKLAQFLVESEKEYRGSIVLGVRTDTQDADGKVLSAEDASGIGREDVEKAFASFRGETDQTPPMVSAIKRDGTPLYVLARRGEVVEREPRRIHIRRLEVLSIDGPVVGFEVTCSRGTYIRTLAADIGDALGCGAHLGNLRRTRVGNIRQSEALALEDVERMGSDLAQAGLSMFDSLPELPVLALSEREEDAVCTGSPISVERDRLGAPEGTMVRLTTDGRELTALGRVARVEEADVESTVRPVRVFAELP